MALRIEEVTSTSKSQRIATHTHIKGLGLSHDGLAVSIAAGQNASFNTTDQCKVSCTPSNHHKSIFDVIQCGEASLQVGLQNITINQSPETFVACTSSRKRNYACRICGTGAVTGSVRYCG